MSKRSQYRDRVMAGLCPIGLCENPPEEGHTRCPEHRAHDAKVREARTASVADTGLCKYVKCHDSAINGTEMCEHHLKVVREYRQKGYFDRKAKGLCTTFGCNEAPAEGSVRCKKHRDLVRESNKARVRAAGTKTPCSLCGDIRRADALDGRGRCGRCARVGDNEILPLCATAKSHGPVKPGRLKCRNCCEKQNQQSQKCKKDTLTS